MSFYHVLYLKRIGGVWGGWDGVCSEEVIVIGCHMTMDKNVNYLDVTVQ